MARIEMELAAEAAKAREEGRPFPALKPGKAVPAFPVVEVERAGDGRAHDLDNLNDLIGDLFDEMEAVFNVLALRLVQNFVNDGDSSIFIPALRTLDDELKEHKESLRNIQSFISQP